MKPWHGAMVHYDRQSWEAGAVVQELGALLEFFRREYFSRAPAHFSIFSYYPSSFPMVRAGKPESLASVQVSLPRVSSGGELGSLKKEGTVLGEQIIFFLSLLRTHRLSNFFAFPFLSESPPNRRIFCWGKGNCRRYVYRRCECITPSRCEAEQNLYSKLSHMG